MKPFRLRGAPAREVHEERERVYTRMVSGARTFGGAVFSQKECQVLKDIFDTLALEATGANMCVENPGQRDESIPTLCGKCGRMDCLGACHTEQKQ